MPQPDLHELAHLLLLVPVAKELHALGDHGHALFEIPVIRLPRAPLQPSLNGGPSSPAARQPLDRPLRRIR